MGRSKTEVMRFLSSTTSDEKSKRGGRGRATKVAKMIEKENIAEEHNTKKEKKKKKKKKKAATFGLNFENRQLKEQEEDYETQTKRQRLEHYREQFPQHQEREATIFVAGVEEDEEEDDDLEDGIVQLQQSQDSEQGFCELSSFVHELLEAPRTATTTATTK